MSRTVGIPPGFLAKLDERQKLFILTAVGRRFYDEVLTKHGHHLFTFGTTGSGKTQKGYWWVHWLKYLETQIWTSTGKTNEILPLLCTGRKVTILTPTGTDVIIEERVGGKWQRIRDHPQVIQVNSPEDMLLSLDTGSWDKSRHRVRDTITILEIRNAFAKKVNALKWLAQLFETLAEWCRLGKMPDIFPATWHFDESQWAVAGKRVSSEPERMRVTEIIAENAMELRSIGIRMAMYSQFFTNLPPTARENMLFNLMCRGADVSPDENSNLSKWCSESGGKISPMKFRPDQGRFVFENGDSYPPKTPWSFRLFPLSEADREWIGRCRVRYVGQHDRQTDEAEIESEMLPDLGRYAAAAIPPERIEIPAGPSRSELPAPDPGVGLPLVSSLPDLEDQAVADEDWL